MFFDSGEGGQEVGVGYPAFGTSVFGYVEAEFCTSTDLFCALLKIYIYKIDTFVSEIVEIFSEIGCKKGRFTGCLKKTPALSSHNFRDIQPRSTTNRRVVSRHDRCPCRFTHLPMHFCGPSVRDTKIKSCAKETNAAAVLSAPLYIFNFLCFLGSAYEE